MFPVYSVLFDGSTFAARGCIVVRTAWGHTWVPSSLTVAQAGYIMRADTEMPEGEYRQMLDRWARRVSAGFVSAIAAVLGRLGLQANTLTLLGCVAQMAVGVLLAYGYLREGGVLLVFGAGIDGIDGTLARQMGGATKFGAFLDSVLDRVSESAILLGLSWWHITQQAYTVAIVGCVALAGSLLVSYTRARAEGIGVQCKEGLFTRCVRTVVLVAALVSGWTSIGLWLLAIGALATAGHRIIHVYLVSRAESRVEEPRPALTGADHPTVR